MQNKKISWREKVFYEYYRAQAFPQTPTTFTVRCNQYKYITYNGVWDINELYDLEKDPNEMNNLICDKAYDKVGLQLRKKLYDWMENTNGLQIPLKKINERKGDHKFRRTY